MAEIEGAGKIVAALTKLQEVQKPLKRYLWVPEDAIVFTPQVLRRPLGDGRALFGIGTLNSRPAYWIFAGDSRWECGCDPYADEASEYIADHIDDILSALEEQFGSADYACPCDCGEYEWSGGHYRCPRSGRFLSASHIEYPTVNYGAGCHWFRLDWPAGLGLKRTTHSFDRRTKILALPESTP